MDESSLPIGIFDSGLGGLTVLKEAIYHLPNESFIYYGDNGNAPYGEKPENVIKELSFHSAKFLLDKGIKALVVACNTATSAAINDLRAQLEIPVIGMEPALKPAVELKEKGKIGVMATPATLRQQKFIKLLQEYGNEEQVIPLPCPGLVDIIESGDQDDHELMSYLECLFSPYNPSEIHVIVLGCTHYVFIKEKIRAFFNNDVILVDGNHGTIMQLKRILEKKKLLNENKDVQKSNIQLFTSGDTQKIVPLFEKILADVETIKKKCLMVGNHSILKA